MRPKLASLALSPALCAVLLAAGAPLASAADIAVPPGGSIQAAMDAAVDGDRVLVAPGVYLQTIDFKGKAIAVIGTGGPAVTILKAPAQFLHVVSFHAAEGEDSVLQGFTVRDGFFSHPGSTFGGGISCTTAWDGPIASPTIRDCWVLANQAAWGGGIAGNPVLERCIIAGNGSGNGGGLWGAPKARDCVFDANWVFDGYGGGVWAQGDDATFERCVFTFNRSYESTTGGAAYVGWSSTTATFTRCLFLDNYTESLLPWYAGHGIAVASSTGPGAGSAQLVQCTVARNQDATSEFGGTLFDGEVDLQGCILWDNVNAITSDDPAVTLSYCDVQGGAPGAGNIAVDPQWVSPLSDMHLKATSPCIDAGAPGALDPDGSPADIGAHAFATLYTRDNATPSALAAPSWPSVSQQVGGQQVLTLNLSPSLSGKLYLVLGSLSGTAPGLGIGAALLPLNPDPYFFYTLNHPNSPVLKSFFGTLPALSPPTFTLAPGALTGLAGIPGHHAALVIDPVSVSVIATTNAEAFQIAD
jgi:hypothetical protein